MDNRPTIAEVQEWVLRLYNTCEQTITDEERKEQHKYAIMVQRPQDKKFLVKMLDESLPKFVTVRNWLSALRS